MVNDLLSQCPALLQFGSSSAIFPKVASDPDPSVYLRPDPNAPKVTGPGHCKRMTFGRFVFHHSLSSVAAASGQNGIKFHKRLDSFERRGIFPICYLSKGILVVDDNVVLGRHVVCNVVIHDQPQQTIEQRQVYLMMRS